MWYLRGWIFTLFLCAFLHNAHASSPPRCLPGDYPQNFHTMLDAAGDTLMVLWCDDATGVGVNALGVNLTTVAATTSCTAALKKFLWSTAWETTAWNSCDNAAPTSAQVQALNSFTANWVPHVKTGGGSVVNAAGIKIGTIAAGINCGLTRMPNNEAYFAVTTPAGYAVCVESFAPIAGWGSPNDTVVKLGSMAPLFDLADNAWSLTSGGVITLNGVADATTHDVLQIVYANGAIWQQSTGLNNTPLWWYKTSPAAAWLPQNGTSVSPL